jgi:hypothetical protein
MLRDQQKMYTQVERARRAEELINDPLLVEAFDNVKKTIETGWQDSSGGDREAREHAYYLLRAVKAVEGKLKAIIINGANARALLELEETRSGGGSS